MSNIFSLGLKQSFMEIDRSSLDCSLPKMLQKGEGCVSGRGQMKAVIDK